jgi:cytochrome c-type biogenesis protein CcmH/NrfG
MTQAGNQSAVHGEIERDARRQIIDREEKLEVERKKALGLGPRTIQQEDAPKELYLFIGIAFLLVMLISFGAVALVFWFFKDKDMEGFGFF